MTTLLLVAVVLVLGAVLMVGDFAARLRKYDPTRISVPISLLTSPPLRLSGLLVVAVLLCCPRAMAEPIVSYDVSFSVEVKILGLTDEEGNPLSIVPSDLSITGRTIDETGSGFFAAIYGPNRPADTTESSFTGSGDVLVGGSPSGDGPLALGIGDGLILNSTVSGSVTDIPLGTSVVVTSDISQLGDIKFINRSPSSTFFANMLISWSFDITAHNNATSGPLFHGYIFDVARRTEGTGGRDFFFQDGIRYLDTGEARRSTGSDSFTSVFAVAPGEEPILTVRTFVVGAFPLPEPSTFVLAGLGGLGLVGMIRRKRRG